MPFKRYNSSNSQDFRTNYVGRAGELTWDNTNGLTLHDGTEEGGNPVAIFNPDGSITVPTLSTTDWDRNGQTGPTLELGNDPDVGQTVITGPAATDVYPNAKRLVIQGQQGYGTSTGPIGPRGGDVLVWAGSGGEGDARGPGGNVELRGGTGGFQGGNILLQSGSTNVPNAVGGFLDLNAGDAINYISGNEDAVGGNVAIRGGLGRASGGAVNIHTSANVTYNNTWTFDSDGSTRLPGTVITSTVTATSNSSVSTALDLTKTINKLSNNPGSWYTLANGVEGQIMYLVPTTGTTNANTYVRVGNARVLSTNTPTAAIFANIAFNPFGTYSSEEPTNVVTMMFTDGAWQSSGGVWD